MAKFVRFRQYKGQEICINGAQVSLLVGEDKGNLTYVHPSGIPLDKEDAGIWVYGSLDEVARKLDM